MAGRTSFPLAAFCRPLNVFRPLPLIPAELSPRFASPCDGSIKGPACLLRRKLVNSFSWTVMVE
jgi:hypothetical protein